MYLFGNKRLRWYFWGPCLYLCTYFSNLKKTPTCCGIRNLEWVEPLQPKRLYEAFFQKNMPLFIYRTNKTNMAKVLSVNEFRDCWTLADRLRLRSVCRNQTVWETGTESTCTHRRARSFNFACTLSWLSVSWLF